METLPLDIKFHIEDIVVKSTHKDVMNELRSHKNTYMNKWGLTHPGFALSSKLPSWFLKQETNEMKKEYFSCDIRFISCDESFELRSIPLDIEFIDNQVNVTYSIFMEDPYSFAKEPMALISHLVGYEKISNIQNDKEELQKLYTFYKELVMMSDGQFMINDGSEWNTGKEKHDMESILNTLTLHMNRLCINYTGI